jgi:hypothetical protein
MTDETIDILQQWADGELSEGQVVEMLGQPRVAVRQMRLDAIAAGDVIELEDEHGHVCPKCSQTYTCYSDCLENAPYKICGDCQ